MTTIVGVKKDGIIAICGDGQVTLGNSVVMKNGAKKVKRIYNDEVITGFAGSVADAFTLHDKFESYLQKHSGNLVRSAVELTKEWRTDKILRNLEAMMIVAKEDKMLLLSGTGEIIEADDNVLAIGSGGNYALAAARALSRHTEMDAIEIATEALKIAGEICVFTNGNLIIETTKEAK